MRIPGKAGPWVSPALRSRPRPIAPGRSRPRAGGAPGRLAARASAGSAANGRSGSTDHRPDTPLARLAASGYRGAAHSARDRWCRPRWLSPGGSRRRSPRHGRPRSGAARSPRNARSAHRACGCHREHGARRVPCRRQWPAGWYRRAPRRTPGVPGTPRARHPVATTRAGQSGRRSARSARYARFAIHAASTKRRCAPARSHTGRPRRAPACRQRTARLAGRRGRSPSHPPRPVGRTPAPSRPDRMRSTCSAYRAPACPSRGGRSTRAVSGPMTEEDARRPPGQGRSVPAVAIARGKVRTWRRPPRRRQGVPGARAVET